MGATALNRQQRRHQGTQTKIDSMEEYRIKKELIAGLKNDIDKIKLELTKELMTKITAALVISLHDTYNFKQKRIKRVLDKAMQQFECIDVGTVTLEDMVSWCKDELKIEL